MATPGTLFIVSAASGTGKTTLVTALINALPNVKVSISSTTRPKRSQEQEGVAYHFISEAEFQTMVRQDEFLEHAEIYGHQYGTTKASVEKDLNAGFDVILEIDWQGAEQVRRLMNDTVGVFILPPSLKVLRERIEKRAQDHEEVIEKRMAAAQEEISHYQAYDYLIVNDDLDIALDELIAILKAERSRRKKQQKRFASVIEELLK